MLTHHKYTSSIKLFTNRNSHTAIEIFSNRLRSLGVIKAKIENHVLMYVSLLTWRSSRSCRGSRTSGKQLITVGTRLPDDVAIH